VTLARRWIPLALVLLCLAGCGSGSDGVAAGVQRELAPDFTLPTLDGGEVSLSDLRGKTVIIDFWATWCPPCEFQVPELNAFYDAHAASGNVAVLGISVDSEGPDVVAAWAREKGIRYQVLLGDEDLARRFGALGFPTLVIVAPDGSIDTRHVGLIERSQLEEALAHGSAGEAAQT
jgi:peroxiredoxin